MRKSIPILKRKKNPLSQIQNKHFDKLERLKILKEAYKEGYITKRELSEGIDEILK